jgi:hypothetical protein
MVSVSMSCGDRSVSYAGAVPGLWGRVYAGFRERCPTDRPFLFTVARNTDKKRRFCRWLSIAATQSSKVWPACRGLMAQGRFRAWTCAITAVTSPGLMCVM